MYNTAIATAEADRIEVYGLDLTSQVIDHLNLGDLCFLGAMRRPPTPAESRLFNAVLVGMAEHGFTPSSLATRYTVLGAPEATQAAIAAGLLGAGSVVLGVMDQTSRMLIEGVAQIGEKSSAEVATEIVRQAEEGKQFLPGFGHPIHKPVDPRTTAFFDLADELGFSGPHIRLMRDLEQALSAVRGKPVVLNGAGAAGAVLTELGIDWRLARACVVAARAAGLVGHVAEELNTGRKGSAAHALLREVNSNANYVSPAFVETDERGQ